MGLCRGFCVGARRRGLSAAAVASGARPLSLLATTTATTNTGTTTTTRAVIADGVTIGGVSVGALTADDAYLTVNDSFSQPLAIVVRLTGSRPTVEIGASAGSGKRWLSQEARRPAPAPS